MRVAGICPECLATFEAEVTLSPGSVFLPRLWCACTGDAGSIVVAGFTPNAPTFVELRRVDEAIVDP